MSPPPLTPNPSKFSYLNYVGEKLFTRDTNITRLSADETPIDSDSLQRVGSKSSTSSSPSHTNGVTEPPVKPPKPEVKPKPGFVKPKPKMESNSKPSTTAASALPAGRTEFKTLSMISTETSIWGSTSSAGTVRLDDELSSPISCTTPIDDSLEQADVFSDEMTNSLTLKHQQMVSDFLYLMACVVMLSYVLKYHMQQLPI